MIHSVCRAACIAVLASVAAAQPPCVPAWQPQFLSGQLDGPVNTILSVPSGNDAALYFGGTFTWSGGQQLGGVVRWDDTGFVSVGTPTIGSINCLMMFDADGPGGQPALLHAGGSFATSGVIRVARLVGSTWQGVGTAGPGGLPNTVTSLVSFDDGSGPTLFAAGNFPYLAKLVGNEWQQITAGLVGDCDRLAVFDDDGPGGNPPALYVLGDYWVINGQNVWRIARWDGRSWSSVGAGLRQTDGLSVFTVFDEDGSQGQHRPALYVGGTFRSIGGEPAGNVAKWDGKEWSALGGGVEFGPWGSSFFSMSGADPDGAGQTSPGLYIGGRFHTVDGKPGAGLAVWRDGEWTAIPEFPVAAGVNVVGAHHRLGNESVLYAGGPFQTPGQYITRLTEAGWRPISNEVIGEIKHLNMFDIGQGPRLFVGGIFNAVEGGHIPAGNLASWDGEQWDPMAGGVHGTIWTSETHDDGTGPALYAGGTFALTAGIPAARIAGWDGGNWFAFGSGLPGIARDAVMYDPDGGGPAPESLVVGGWFGLGPSFNQRIARWTGAAWEPLVGGQSGAFGAVNALLVHDDGSGPSLLAGGGFNYVHLGQLQTSGLMRWDGQQWSTVDDPASPTTMSISALCRFDDGSGAAMYAAGEFTQLAGSPFRVAERTGQTWTALGTGFGAAPTFSTLKEFSHAGAPALFVAGQFTQADGQSARHIARWTGSAWAPVGDGAGGVVGPGGTMIRSLCVFDDGTGDALYAGGQFWEAGGVPANDVARWNGTAWSALAGGIDGEVLDMAVFDDGSGAALFVGGNFSSVPGASSPGLAKWDGTHWLPAPSVGGLSEDVYMTRVVAPGGVATLLVGGEFTRVGKLSANGVVRWMDDRWLPLGTGVNNDLYALASFDVDGPGGDPPSLFVGGEFTAAGGAGASKIARWDGAAWHGVDGGVNGAGDIVDLHVFDDGGGAALYAAGTFTGVGGMLTDDIARWTVAGWEAVGGSGIAGSQCRALATFDDGTGARLYAAGTFTGVYNGTTFLPASNIARWSGTAWAAAGGGLNGAATALHAKGTGAGSRLFATGSFTNAGGAQANRVAQWSGGVWSALGTGVNGAPTALAQLPEKEDIAIYVGGPFTQAGGILTKGLAVWSCGPDTVPCYPDCNGDTVVTVADFGCFQTRFVSVDPWADCNQDLVLNVSDFGCFQTKFVVGCP